MIHYLFLIDNSYSMNEETYKIYENLVKIIYKLQSQLRNQKIFLTIAYFHNELYYIYKFTDVQKIYKHFNYSQLIDYGATSLYDSLCTLLLDFQEYKIRNKLFIITDGDDNRSIKYTKEDVEKLCNKAKNSGLWEIHHFVNSNVFKDIFESNTNILYNDITDIFSNLKL